MLKKAIISLVALTLLWLAASVVLSQPADSQGNQLDTVTVPASPGGTDLAGSNPTRSFEDSDQVDVWVPFSLDFSPPKNVETAKIVMVVKPIGQLIGTDQLVLKGVSGKSQMVYDKFSDLQADQWNTVEVDVSGNSDVMDAIRKGHLEGLIQDDTAVQSVKLIISGTPSNKPKDCNEDCKQRDPNSVWDPSYSDENPEGPNLCTCRCADNYGMDEALACQPCESICNTKGQHIICDKEGSISGKCVCGCDEKNGWVSDGKGGCEPKATDCHIYCSNSGAHKVWDRASSAPTCNCICDGGYHFDDGGNCIENIKRPIQFMGDSVVLGTFLTNKLQYTEGACDDFTRAPIGSVILWGRTPDSIDHATIVVSEYLQLGMESVAYLGRLDKSPEPFGKPYICRKVYYPPSSTYARLLNPLNVEPIVAKYKNKDRHFPTNRNIYVWDCWGFAANLAYELLGGEEILNPTPRFDIVGHV